ncbi:uncharacterized protein METZ01_LOCUS317533 [marine metagenome]|uniref:Uncharacterized protein n=1 Tax=marine metagenome TaxID=408172 RepID=A0A382NU35_9ZZZZ
MGTYIEKILYGTTTVGWATWMMVLY